MVALVHPAQLPHHDVTFVKEHDGVLGEVVDQTGRRFPRGKSRQMPGVVFDSFAEPHLIEHLKIKKGSLLQARRFDFLAFGMQLRQTLL